MGYVETFFLLMVGHAVADFALQSPEMGAGKNRNRRIEPPPGQKYTPCWPYYLSAHALIHGGAVYIVTGSLMLGLIETTAHWVIDFAKCENWTTPHQDQGLHVLCKAAYLAA